MIVTKMALPRRTFLRGMGTALALPLLDAMVPALSAVAQTAASPVRRLGFVYIPMGMNAAAWTPALEGHITDLSPSLGPLAPFLDQLTVFTNLELRNAYTTGNHASANCAFLSCVKAKRTEGTDYQLGTTVDQLAAQSIGKATPIPSLELGTDLIAQVGNCDNGYACAYQNNLSWSSATTPLPTEADPRVVFERLFGDGGKPGSAPRRVEEERQHPRLDDQRHGPAAKGAWPGRSDEAGPVPRLGSRSGAPYPEGGAAERRHAIAGSRAPGHGACRLGRPREADVRSAAARPAGRPHAGHHVPAGARNQHANLSANRRARAASPRLAPYERSGEAREAGQDQRVSRVAVREFRGETAGDAGRRRLTARPFDVSAGQRHGQSRHPQSHQPADRPGRGQDQQAERGTAHQDTSSRHRSRIFI